MPAPDYDQHAERRISRRLDTELNPHLVHYRFGMATYGDQQHSIIARVRQLTLRFR